MATISDLEINEQIFGDLYLRNLSLGIIQGPPTGKASLDKPWLKNYPEEAITSYVSNESIYEYLKKCISSVPDVVLLDYFGEKITAKQLLEKIDATAERLKKSGIEVGECVALVLPNVPETVYNVYALNKIGAISCIIDPRQNESDILRDMKHVNATACISIDFAMKKIKNIAKQYNFDLLDMVSLFDSVSKKTPQVFLLNVFITLQNVLHGNYSLKKKKMCGCVKNGFAFINNNDNDVAAIVHTGGTSGKHKGVMVSNSALNQTVHDHKYIIDDVKVGDTIYNPLPQFMSYGLTTMHLSLCNKLHMYMMSIASPKTFGADIFKLKPSIIYGGPIHYLQGRKSKKMQKADLSHTKIAVSGGERLGSKEEQQNNDFYCSLGMQDELYNGYGASETSGVYSVKKGRHNSFGSVGYPFPKNNIKILDPNTGEELCYLTDGKKSGDIYITGASMMVGYDDDSETEKVISDGWFATGDIGYMNSDGELFVTGRKKRQFVSGVDKVYVPILEDLIENISGVEKCVIVPVPDDELRKVPYAFLKLDDESFATTDITELKKCISVAVQQKNSVSSVPKYFDFTTHIEYTPNGKVDFMKMEKIAKSLVEEKKGKVKVKEK